GRLYRERTLVFSRRMKGSCYVLRQESAGLGAGDADGRGYRDDRIRAFRAERHIRRDGRLSDRGHRRGRDPDRLFRLLSDVRHGRPQASLAMTARARAGRCDPSLIEAARSGDADALVSLIAVAQPDIRRYAARNCRAADIDDAVQETLLLLYRRVGTLRA